MLKRDFHSKLVDEIRSRGNSVQVDGMTLCLAAEFGFCYGVDRAIDYAYQTAFRFPGRRVFLLGEIIHNPHVNRRMEEMGIHALIPTEEEGFDFSGITPDDVVLIPAFGVTLDDFSRLSRIGCTLVDTTCGSVLNVWKRVRSYARDGFTALIHGKYAHEEARATASQVAKHADGRYIIVRDMEETRLLCNYIEERPDALDREAFCRYFQAKASEGFDPDRDLQRIGVANQTTMLASESLAIADALKQCLERRYGAETLAEHFRTFDTICSATQERQDAIIRLMEEPPDIMIVIGGYNSSNTNHLAHICRRHCTTYHIADAECIHVPDKTIWHKPAAGAEAPEVATSPWLPDGNCRIGFTAGASTPDNRIGHAIERTIASRGIPLPDSMSLFDKILNDS